MTKEGASFVAARRGYGLSTSSPYGKVAELQSKTSAYCADTATLAIRIRQYECGGKTGALRPITALAPVPRNTDLPRQSRKPLDFIEDSSAWVSVTQARGVHLSHPTTHRVSAGALVANLMALVVIHPGSSAVCRVE